MIIGGYQIPYLDKTGNLVTKSESLGEISHFIFDLKKREMDMIHHQEGWVEIKKMKRTTID